MNVFSSPQPLPTPNVYEAVYDFIMMYALPLLNPDNIVIGWENRFTLPPDTNDYAVMTLIANTRRGTNVTEYDPQAETLKKLKLSIVDVQIDLCSDSESNAFNRANALATVASDEIGTSFFEQYGISCLNADDPKGLETVSSSNQFIYRYMLTLHLSYWSGVIVSVPYANTIKFNIENVDVHHPPSTSE